MATRFVSSTGSSTSPYDTWAKAATSLATAITGSAAGDVFVIDNANPGADVTSNTTWTFVGSATVIASTNSGTSTITPTTMGTSAWLGAGGATSYSLAITASAASSRVYIYGITLRVAGSTNLGLSINAGDSMHFEFEDCYLWLGTTNGSPRINIGSNSSGGNAYCLFKECTFRFGATSQGLSPSGRVEFNGGEVSASGSAPTTLIGAQNNTQEVLFFGANLSHVTGTLVASQTGSSAKFSFVQCRFGGGVVPMAAQTLTNKSSALVFVQDCSDGDTHGLFGYYDAFGSVESDTGTRVTAGAAAQSWKITTTANCGFGTPFVTPWINLYSAASSATTYKLELLRNNGTATTYSDSEVWGEFSVKDNSGFTNSDVFTDRQALVDWAAGTSGSTAGRTGTGTGNWTIGASNSPASFIVDSGSSITHAENGHIRARVAVGLASVSNLFLDPQIRT